MLNEERRRAILEILNRDGRVLVLDLARQFETSQVTIRKDLETLHAHGLIHRTHGGALPAREGALLDGLEARIVDEDDNLLPARAVGVIEVRGEPVTRGYVTVAGFVAAQDELGWYDTGDLGYVTEDGHVVVCGRVKDVIIMGGRSVYPTDVERAAGRVDGVRPGCAVAVRLDAGHSRESFAVAVESNSFEDPREVRRIRYQVAHQVLTEVDMRPRKVVVLGPGVIPKTPSGKLRRAYALSLVS